MVQPIGGMKSKKNKLPIEREGIKADNPEKYYTFEEEAIGEGKFSVVKRVVCKRTGAKFAAKIIKFDSDTLQYAIREYDLMTDKLTNIKDSNVKAAIPQIHETYLVRKYLIIIMTLCDGKTLLDFFASKASVTEDDVATVIRQLCTILNELSLHNIVHLDIRPTNIRVTQLHSLKLLDWNSAKKLANKKAGEVVDVLGDTEFCAPEMLAFDKVQPTSDMWSVAVIMYTLLSGESPFYYEDESKVSLCVEKVQYKFTPEDIWQSVTAEAKDFIKCCFKRAPEMRLTAAKALEHKWLSEEYEPNRKRSHIVQQELLRETDTRLFGEEEEEYVLASLVFRTFEEEEYESPDESDEEEEDEE